MAGLCCFLRRLVTCIGFVSKFHTTWRILTNVFDFSVENDCIEFFEDEDCFRLHFNSNDLYSKLDILEALNIPVDSSFLAHVPKDEIKLSKDEHDKVEKLLDFLEELEDIQNVFSNQTLGLN